jgi:hypothetical protein
VGPDQQGLAHAVGLFHLTTINHRTNSEDFLTTTTASDRTRAPGAARPSRRAAPVVLSLVALLLSACVKSGVSGCDCADVKAALRTAPWLGHGVRTKVVEQRSKDFVGSKQVTLLITPTSAMDIDARLVELADAYEAAGFTVFRDEAAGKVGVGVDPRDGIGRYGERQLELARITPASGGTTQLRVAVETTMPNDKHEHPDPMTDIDAFVAVLRT